jgi:hypothetical protein
MSNVSEQNFKQKIGIIPTILFELYKVIISSFLILFSPQKCGDHICSLDENLDSSNITYTIGLIMNFITMGAFLIFYGLEIKRENKLINYLEVNETLPSDSVSVGIALEKLHIDKRNSLYILNTWYQRSGCFVLGMFILNTGLSAYVVHGYYSDNQTLSTFITSVLFMVGKLYDIYFIVSTEKNVFYSSYLKSKIQYNDVDPNKKITPMKIPIGFGISIPLDCLEMCEPDIPDSPNSSNSAINPNNPNSHISHNNPNNLYSSISPNNESTIELLQIISESSPKSN